MDATFTKVGTRWRIGQTLLKMQSDKTIGIITDVKLTRISLFVWHLEVTLNVKS